MSLLLIVRKVWRYRLATLPVVALVVAGFIYVIVGMPPTYETSSAYMLVNPPAPPTEAQIAANPALAGIDADNPYMRFSDGTVVVQVLASRLSSETARKSLANHGADPNYTAMPSIEFGFGAPILEVTGTGTTPRAAVKTAELVGLAATRELDRMQEIRGVDKDYRIKVEPVVDAQNAMLKASGKLRALVAVFALGTIMMFIVVSVLDALSALRTQWARGRSDEYFERGRSDEYFELDGFLDPVMSDDSLPASHPEPNGAKWPLEAKR